MNLSLMYSLPISSGRDEIQLQDPARLITLVLAYVTVKLQGKIYEEKKYNRFYLCIIATIMKDWY